MFLRFGTHPPGGGPASQPPQIQPAPCLGSVRPPPPRGVPLMFCHLPAKPGGENFLEKISSENMIFVEFLRDLGGVVKKKLDFRGVPHGFGPFWTKKMTFEKFDPWSVPASQLQPGRPTPPPPGVGGPSQPAQIQPVSSQDLLSWTPPGGLKTKPGVGEVLGPMVESTRSATG